MLAPRIVLAAPKSGSGKTLLTCALLEAMKQRKQRVRAFKCGPDYIDPMFHQKVLGIPSRNLDLFFTGEEQTRALFLRDGNEDELSVIEGVMGLYDGLAGTSEKASTYHLAKALKAPIVLVVNARGMGRSILAEIAGFLSMDEEKLIRGVILNQTNASLYQLIAPMIESKFGVAALGFFPNRTDLALESRYLGLKLPDEVEALHEKVAQAATQLAETVDLERILAIANEAPELVVPLQEESAEEQTVRIAVARDEAFCFYYEDNLKTLEQYGAEIVFFSPLRDKSLPVNVHGVLLGGGYPELLAKELSENEEMKAATQKALAAGLPSLAECGGFMYLHDTLKTQDEKVYQMAGLIHGDCFYTGKLVRFGYAEVTMPDGNVVKGHEFHYFDSTANGEDCVAEKPITGKNWRLGHYGENHFWSFAHLYYPSCPQFAKWFVERCRAYKAAH